MVPTTRCCSSRTRGQKYHPAAVLLSFYIGNDVRNNWYPLEERDSGGPRKPVFDLTADGLTLERYPFVEHGSLKSHVKIFLSRHVRLYAFARDLRDRFRARDAPTAQAAA